MPGAQDNGDQVRSIAFFGYDSAESTLIKRVRSFQALGSRVVGLMFRRERGLGAPQPTWENIDLGETTDRNYLRRVPKLLGAIATALRHRSLLRQCGIWYARNIDMLLVAAVTKALMRSDSVLVYEVLDVQRIFLGQRPVNRAARWVERLLLRRCALLVVSSPDFIDRYYQPVQRLSVPWRLIENKIAFGSMLAARGAQTVPPAPPWVIGWFGTLRCARSLDILCKIARALGDKVQIVLRGRASDEDLPQGKIDAATARHPNITFGGAYKNPDDLAELYGGVHFSWSVDYLDAGTNSDWLLPNRIYEGGYFGSLALARRDTATGRLVDAKGLGWSFAEPLNETVAEFLAGLDVENYERVQHAVGAIDRSMFVDERDTRELLEHLDTLWRCEQPSGDYPLAPVSERATSRLGHGSSGPTSVRPDYR